MPSLARMVWVVLTEQLYSLWLLIAGSIPYIWDLLRTHFKSPEQRLPQNVLEASTPEAMTRLIGRKVTGVRRSKGMDQHANSTDRDWLVLTTEEGKEEKVFVKTAAKNAMVRSMLSIFGVYKNELLAYMGLDLPVRTPTVHCAKYTPSRFVIIMEDLSSQGVDFPNIWREPACTYDKASKVLSTYARLHAHYMEAVPGTVWNDQTRPYFGKVVGLVTLHRFLAQVPGVIPESVLRDYKAALWRWDEVRELWSAASPQTMVHGDSHYGNTYAYESGEVGLIDMQCVAREHPMRDVTYFLASGYPHEDLARDENRLIAHYLSELAEELRKRGNSSLRAPTFAEAWEQYQLQSFYAMYAFVFSGGVGGDLMDSLQGRVGVRRIGIMMERVGAGVALSTALCRQSRKK